MSAVSTSMTAGFRTTAAKAGCTVCGCLIRRTLGAPRVAGLEIVDGGVRVHRGGAGDELGDDPPKLGDLRLGEQAGHDDEPVAPVRIPLIAVDHRPMVAECIPHSTAPWIASVHPSATANPSAVAERHDADAEHVAERGERPHARHEAAQEADGRGRALLRVAERDQDRDGDGKRRERAAQRGAEAARERGDGDDEEHRGEDAERKVPRGARPCRGRAAARQRELRHDEPGARGDERHVRRPAGALDEEDAREEHGPAREQAGPPRRAQPPTHRRRRTARRPPATPARRAPPPTRTRRPARPRKRTARGR